MLSNWDFEVIFSFLFFFFCHRRHYPNLSNKDCVCAVMSDSVWPHGLQPTRLLCPWNFPGKNTGAGCYFFLQGIFPGVQTQRLNSCLLCLLHWQVSSLTAEPSGKPHWRDKEIILLGWKRWIGWILLTFIQEALWFSKKNIALGWLDAWMDGWVDTKILKTDIDG